MSQSSEIWKIPIEEYAPEKPEWAKRCPDAWTKTAQEAWKHVKYYKMDEWYKANEQAYKDGKDTQQKPIWAMTFLEFCGDDIPDDILWRQYKKACGLSEDTLKGLKYTGG